MILWRKTPWESVDRVGREGIEQRTGKDWSQIVDPHDADLDGVAAMLKDLAVKEKAAWTFVNNHFEGSAPCTIERLEERL